MLKKLFLKIQLWFTKNKKCKRCCVLCEYFDDCYDDIKGSC